MLDTLNSTSAAAVAASSRLEVVTFTLGDEEYAVDIQRVQELRRYEAVTRIANAPDFIKGVVNLRGAIVPIVDLRIKFRLGTPTYHELTVVIVLNIRGRVLGMVVDSVSDVITLEADEIKPPPQMGSELETEYLMGLGTRDDRMLILVDIDRLLSGAEMGLIARATAA